MTEDQDVRSVRRAPAFAALYLGIGPAQTDAHDVDQDIAVGHEGLGYDAHSAGARASRHDRERSHRRSIWAPWPRYCRAMVTLREVERIFREAGAFREGHFVLASGKHSSWYLEKFQVLQWPVRTAMLCADIAEWASRRSLAPRIVAGPTTGGIILAHEVARQLELRAVYAERIQGARGREFRRGFELGS